MSAAHAEWEGILDAFEHDLGVVPEEMTAWQPPAPAPLPTALRTRAEQVLAHQEERIAQLKAALAEVHQQLDQLRPRPVGRSETAAVYVDLRA